MFKNRYWRARSAVLAGVNNQRARWVGDIGDTICASSALSVDGSVDTVIIVKTVEKPQNGRGKGVCGLLQLVLRSMSKIKELIAVNFLW